MSKWNLLLLIGGTGLLATSTLPAADDFAWGAAIRGTQLIVVVDTRNSPLNLVVDSASFNATFFGAARQNLGTQNFELPANRMVHGQLFRVAYGAPASAVRVEVGTIAADLRTGGTKADGREIETTSSDPQVSAPIVVMPPSPASPEQRCAEYGRRASHQNARNLAMSCGYSGNRWQSAPDFHAQWCRGASPSEVDAETVERDMLLRRCARLKASSTVVK